MCSAQHLTTLARFSARKHIGLPNRQNDANRHVPLIFSYSYTRFTFLFAIDAITYRNSMIFTSAKDTVFVCGCLLAG